LSTQLSFRAIKVHAAIRGLSQAIRNDNTDSIDDRQEEEASDQNEHCDQVLFQRVGPAKKNNWTAHEKQVDHRETAPKAIPRLPHQYNLQGTNCRLPANCEVLQTTGFPRRESLSRLAYMPFTGPCPNAGTTARLFRNRKRLIENL
jgi:hypothetical protein